MSDVLSITGARKRFGETVALDGADLRLRRGEWLALLGPNGAGKTTLVRAVHGRVRLDEGRIELLGHTMTGTTADRGARTQLGLVPQELALYPTLTAEENLRAFGSYAGLARKEIDDRIAWALEWTGLAARSREPVKRFSGGMKRRLNVAAGVLHQPQVLLLDEPTVGVDPQSRERIREMLGELHAEGTTLLLTTHQLDEAQSVAERIVIIDRGKVAAEGTFEELLESTIGTRRRVTVKLADGSTATRSIQDVSAELPGLLAEFEKEGRIADLRVEAPSLQAVFLHLTGRELRE